MKHKPTPGNLNFYCSCSILHINNQVAQSSEQAPVTSEVVGTIPTLDVWHSCKELVNNWCGIKEGFLALGGVFVGRRRQREGRLDCIKERGHFRSRLNQSLKCRNNEIQTCSSNQRQFIGHVNTRWVSILTWPYLGIAFEFQLAEIWIPMFRDRVQRIIGQKRFWKKEKVSYDKVYKKLLRQQLILHLIHIIVIIIIINSINPRRVGLVSIHHNYNNQYHYKFYWSP